MAQTDETLPLSTRSDTIGQLAGLAAPLALGAGALYYPRLAQALKMVRPGQRLATGGADYGGRNLAKQLMHDYPALKQGAIKFDANEAPLSLLSHETEKHSIPAFAGMGQHELQFGLHPPGFPEPIDAAKLDLLTNMDPDKAPGYVTGLSMNQALKLHPSEFHGMQDKIQEFLAAYGVDRMASNPASESRARLFRGGLY